MEYAEFSEWFNNNFHGKINKEEATLLYNTLKPKLDEFKEPTPVKEDEWIDNSISTMQLNIGRLEVNCFDEDAEMSIKVGGSRYQSLTVDEAKELANFIVSHIKNETEANPTENE